MKKIMGVIISLLLVLTVLTAPVSAVSLSAGTSKLNAQFKKGDCPGNLDYVAFSPVKGSSDTTKYPLFIWLHGMNSGTYKGAQLNYYEFSNWASDEYQSRFVNAGGCFLLAPRASTSSINSWSSDMCSSLKTTIDYYISQYSANIDMDRIYISGYSTGGTMVWDMLTRYPDFFAAGMPAGAIIQPLTTGLAKLDKVSVWMFACDIDYYGTADSADVWPNFNYLKATSNNLDGYRITTFSEAHYADGSKKMVTENGVKRVADEAEHYIWECITYDMHMTDGSVYVCGTTVDGNGNVIDFSDGTGIIDWLSRQTRAEEKEDKKISFFEKISLYFTRLFAYYKNIFNRFFGK